MGPEQYAVCPLTTDTAASARGRGRARLLYPVATKRPGRHSQRSPSKGPTTPKSETTKKARIARWPKEYYTSRCSYRNVRIALAASCKNYHRMPVHVPCHVIILVGQGSVSSALGPRPCGMEMGDLPVHVQRSCFVLVPP
eukprot:407249-Prymnesium_polylepis.2